MIRDALLTLLPVRGERDELVFFSLPSLSLMVVVVAYNSLRLNWSASGYHCYSRVFLLLPLW